MSLSLASRIKLVYGLVLTATSVVLGVVGQLLACLSLADPIFIGTSITIALLYPLASFWFAHTYEFSRQRRGLPADRLVGRDWFSLSAVLVVGTGLSAALFLGGLMTNASLGYLVGMGLGIVNFPAAALITAVIILIHHYRQRHHPRS